MSKALFINIALLSAFLLAPAKADETHADIIYVQMETSKGDIYLALDHQKAPMTVDHFISHIDDYTYIRTIFHRTIPGTLIQGGGYDKYGYGRGNNGTLQNEADNGLKNVRGTIAMARQLAPHSATSQFFINIKDMPQLDHIDKELIANWGYAVFGKVIGGMDVADKISAVPTHSQDQFDKNFPIDPITLKDIEVISKDDVVFEAKEEHE